MIQNCFAEKGVAGMMLIISLMRMTMICIMLKHGLSGVCGW